MAKMNILVTGGAGYIGSHIIVELLANNYEPIIIDNFSNSSPEVLKRLTKITLRTPKFYEGDIRDEDLIRSVFDENHIDAVIHLAGLKSVGESVSRPLDYYDNNISSSVTLFRIMKENGVKKLIFSSSATVYGTPDKLPIDETNRVGFGITNPYGKTKYMTELILSDLAMSDPTMQITVLRYFNPIGAHSSGLIGEDPNGIPNNLLPYISQVAVGKLDKLKIYGNDYDTPDGTGIRDYIHVVDLAKGHVAALGYFKKQNMIEIYNLGAGRGASVLQVIRTFEKASGRTIPYEIVARRPGDVASCYANASKARSILNWKSEKTLMDACIDTWNWQKNNPNGYKTPLKVNLNKYNRTPAKVS